MALPGGVQGLLRDYESLVTGGVLSDPCLICRADFFWWYGVLPCKPDLGSLLAISRSNAAYFMFRIVLSVVVQLE